MMTKLYTLVMWLSSSKYYYTLNNGVTNEVPTYSLWVPLLSIICQNNAEEMSF